jgi:hypothetical protein
MQEKIGLDVSEYRGKSVGLMWIPWKINIPHFVFIRATVGMTDWTSNLMKIGVAQKQQPYPGAYLLPS